MPVKERKLVPATREKTCQICGDSYTYPQKGVNSTRFHCETCATVPEPQRRILTKMAKRIQSLERKLKS